MNKNEIVKFLILVKSNYPNYYKDSDELADTMLINSWHKAFHDIPSEVMISAFDKHLLTKKFPPTVSELRESAVQIISPVSQISGDIAWDLACKKVASFGRYRKDEGMASLRQQYPTIARTVDAIGWGTICNAPLEGGFVKRDFLAYYEQVDAPEREQNLIPDAMWKKIQETQNKHKQLELKPNELPEV
jgi:hypothetical protein